MSHKTPVKLIVVNCDDVTSSWTRGQTVKVSTIAQMPESIKGPITGTPQQIFVIFFRLVGYSVQN